jgi:uncharacterized protein (DUF433 family)
MVAQAWLDTKSSTPELTSDRGVMALEQDEWWATVTGELLAVTEDKAAALADVSVRQLRYWDEISLVGPSVHHSFGPRTNVRLYGFGELMELLVAAELRRAPGIAPRHIRRVVAHLRARGYDRPLQQLVFAVAGNELYFQHPDGTWEGGYRPDQIVIQQVIDLARIQAKIASATERAPDAAGGIERRRKTLGYKPVFAGTRVPFDKVRNYLEHGFSTEQIIEAFPVLTAADVEAARQSLASTKTA